MRIECPQCRELTEVTRFTASTDPPRIVFRCAACGAEVSEDLEEGGPAVKAPAAGEGEGGGEGGGAPRAASAVPSGAADPAGPARPAAEPAARDRQDALWNQWDHVTRGFDEEARHDAFLAACEVAEALPFAAARYREWAESHPEDAVAPAKLKRITALAQVKALLKADRGPKERDPLRQAVVLGLVLLVVIAVVVITAPLVFQGVAGDAGKRGEGRRAPGPTGPRLENLRRPRPYQPRRPRPVITAPRPDAGVPAMGDAGGPAASGARPAPAPRGPAPARGAPIPARPRPVPPAMPPPGR